jgi:hypothetical protein
VSEQQNVLGEFGASSFFFEKMEEVALLSFLFCG